MNLITVVSLGNSPDSLTLGSLEAMRSAQWLILRTEQTPSADYLHEKGIAYETLDVLYEDAEDFDALNAALTQAVLEAAEATPVVYAVLDAQWDESVHSLMESHADQVKVLPGAGLFDGLRLLHPAARICAAEELPTALGDEELLIVEIDSALLAGEIKLRLIDWFGADCPCVWYAPSLEPVRRGKAIPLQDLDRQKKYDHTAALYLAPQPLTNKERYTVHDLVRIMEILRGPEGCPWDQAQTHESLRPYLVEEAYEVTQAIREEDWLHVADELGDVLLQVVFQANIGDQYGTLTLSDVTTAICRKMIHRHPHIFDRTVADTPEAVSRNWDAIKREERGQKGLSDVLNDIPASLPPLMRAQKVLRKANGLGAETEDGQVALGHAAAALERLSKTKNGSDEARQALGELLFACVNLARVREVDSEVALADVTDGFVRKVCEENASTAKKQ